ncbi:MAG TPA: YdeI/OmpD-associated family protein [Chitinophagaceae bacterium]|nr:YdeI/OmpD-associated family protein [Chitinophagaceae bacterium]
MIGFRATIHRFDKQGEKTGWTYIEVPADIAGKLKPGTKTSFRVKGKLDHHKIEGVALMPMGGGRFIMPLNAALRKAIGKRQGAMLRVQLAVDSQPFRFNQDFLACLNDEPAALAFFKTLPGSHQRYFSKWIDEAKTELTRTKRIAQAVNALSVKLGYGGMLRMNQKK